MVMVMGWWRIFCDPHKTSCVVDDGDGDGDGAGAGEGDGGGGGDKKSS